MSSKEKYKYEVASNGVIRTVVKPTPWNGILLEKPIVVQVIRICPLSWHPTFDCCIREAVANTCSEPDECIPRNVILSSLTLFALVCLGLLTGPFSSGCHTKDVCTFHPSLMPKHKIRRVSFFLADFITVNCLVKTESFKLISRSAQIPGSRAPWLLNRVRWRVIFVDPQYGICFVPYFERVEY